MRFGFQVIYYDNDTIGSLEVIYHKARNIEHSVRFRLTYNDQIWL